METKIYKNYQDFFSREDKRINGVTLSFLEENNINLDDLNLTSCEGCFNCVNCESCRKCYNCGNCYNCENCEKCYNCENCENCKNGENFKIY